MVKMQVKPRNRYSFWRSGLAVLAMPVLAMAVLSATGAVAGDNQAGDSAGNADSERWLLALHTGEKHDLIPEERESSGICPQDRKTVRAPDEFYFKENPLKPTEQNRRAGETLFKIDAKPTACRVCHGFGGNGMGILFQQLSPKPRNFTCYYTMREIPDGQLFWVIKNGSPGTRMPSFAYLSDEEVWQLILFIRKLAP